MSQPFDFDKALKALQSGKAKTVKTPTGAFELATPGDRNGSFEPQRVKKHQTMLSDFLIIRPHQNEVQPLLSLLQQWDNLFNQSKSMGRGKINLLLRLISLH